MMPQGGKRVRKQMRLAEATIATVAQFAEQHQLNFSQAAEYLILIGLQDTKTMGQAALYRTVTEQAIHRVYESETSTPQRIVSHRVVQST